LGSNEPSLDARHRGMQRRTFHFIFLILENLFSPNLQVVISPKNYFLFTPLLPSIAVGTLNPRSIIQPTRYTTRRKSRNVSEAEATNVDVSVEQLFANNVDTDVLKPCSERTRPLPSLSSLSCERHRRNTVQQITLRSRVLRVRLQSSTITWSMPSVQKCRLSTFRESRNMPCS
jgi:hypothetical protein